MDSTGKESWVNDGGYLKKKGILKENQLITVMDKNININGG